MGQVIQHYNPAAKTFSQPVNAKVKKLIELGLINKLSDGVYSISPIPGYNITNYTVRELMGRLTCNCQGYRKYNRCAHADAVRIYREKTEPKEQQMHIL